MLGGQKMALHPMDYQIAPIPDNEAARLAALRSAMCAYVPREERFDRITRMAQRMLHVPMAMISIVEDDVRWFRSVQGLVKTETSRDMSFCAHAIVSDGVFQVCDTLLDNRFNVLPAVLGPLGTTPEASAALFETTDSVPPAVTDAVLATGSP